MNARSSGAACLAEKEKIRKRCTGGDVRGDAAGITGKGELMREGQAAKLGHGGVVPSKRSWGRIRIVSWETLNSWTYESASSKESIYPSTQKKEIDRTGVMEGTRR